VGIFLLTKKTRELKNEIFWLSSAPNGKEKNIIVRGIEWHHGS
jgi:hypothetical protein